MADRDIEKVYSTEEFVAKLSMSGARTTRRSSSRSTGRRRT